MIIPAKGFECRVGLGSLFQCSERVQPGSTGETGLYFALEFLGICFKCSFAKRLQSEVFDSAVLLSRGLEGVGTEILSTWLLGACGCRP